MGVDPKAYKSSKAFSFALHDGSIRISRKLIRVLSDEDLIAELARQIGHIRRGNSKRRLERAYAAATQGTKVYSVLNPKQLKVAEHAFFSNPLSKEEKESANNYVLDFLRNYGYRLDYERTSRLSLASLDQSYPLPKLPKKKQLPKKKLKKVASTKITKKKKRFSVKPKPAWYIQVAAEENKEQALSKLKSLRSFGIKPLLQKTTVNKKQYFRVLVGPYRSLRQAKRVRPKITALGVAKGTPFIAKRAL